MASKQLDTFFSLPPELRNQIYELVLVPDRPIDLAAMSLRSGKFRHPGFDNDGYDRERYLKQIQPSLTLLRANKQINNEATPIYYGQEFRFTNRLGWYFLYNWLILIGHRNRMLVRNIVVIHPGVCQYLPDEDPLGMLEYRGKHDVEASPLGNLFPEGSVGKYERKDLKLSCKMFKKRNRPTKLWFRNSNPTALLKGMTELETLKFVVFVNTTPFYFPWISRHVIHNVNFSTNLRISVVNLVQHRASHREFKLADVYGNSYHPLDNPDDPNNPGPGEKSRRVVAREFWDFVKDKGWDAEEMVFDNHFTYPVADSSHCNDADICEYLQEKGCHKDPTAPPPEATG